MITNFLKTMFRNAARFRFHTLINLFGLSVGMGATILVLAIVKNQFSFDMFNVNQKRIYRVFSVEERTNGQKLSSSIQPLPLGPALKSEFPGVKAAVRLFSWDGILDNKDRKFHNVITFTDPQIFSVFTLPMIEGDPKTALRQPNAVVLTEETARKLFGTVDPISRSLKIIINGKPEEYLVTGVVRDIPLNSSIRFNALLPIDSWPLYDQQANQWGASNGTTFILLSKSSKPMDMEKSFQSFVNKYFGGTLADEQADGFLSKSPDALRLRLEPLSDIHFSTVEFALEPKGNILYPSLLSAIAGLILIIACINFITVSLARSSSRAKEVGVRKVMGGTRRTLIAQFLGESIVLAFGACTIGIALAELAVPALGQLLGEPLQIHGTFSAGFIIILLSLVTFVGALAGAYPGFLLSRLQPTEVLRGKVRVGAKNAFSKALVVFQFASAASLIIATMVVWEQLDFIKGRDLGYDPENIVVLPIYTGLTGGESLVDDFRNSLSDYAGVTSVTGTTSAFTFGAPMISFEDKDITHRTYFYRVDQNFIPTLRLKLIEGTNFHTSAGGADVNSAIVNQEFVKEMGWHLPAIGRIIANFNGHNEVRIVGVVEDFNFASLHERIAPVMLMMDPRWPISDMLIRINEKNIGQTMSALEKSWNRMAPDKPFDYSFLAQDIQKQYLREYRWRDVICVSSIFAMLIACLGLFGLSSLSAEMRKKEVGIRKTLGASYGNIAMSMSWDFLMLVVVANLVAWPIVWYAANKWLQSFAYRINVGVWVFFLAGMITCGIAILAIGWQVLRIAATNPVEALRYE